MLYKVISRSYIVLFQLIVDKVLAYDEFHGLLKCIDQLQILKGLVFFLSL